MLVNLSPGKIQFYYMNKNENGTFDIDIETDDIEIKYKNVLVHFEQQPDGGFIVPQVKIVSKDNI